MGKIIFWLVVAFSLLLILRLANARQARRMRAAQDRAAKEHPPEEQVVRCVECGVYIPRAQARSVANGFRCADAECRTHTTPV